MQHQESLRFYGARCICSQSLIRRWVRPLIDSGNNSFQVDAPSVPTCSDMFSCFLVFRYGTTMFLHAPICCDMFHSVLTWSYMLRYAPIRCYMFQYVTINVLSKLCPCAPAYNLCDERTQENLERTQIFL